MKGIIIGLSAALVVIIILAIGLIIYGSKHEFYNTVDHVDFEKILDETEGNHLYYFYQPSCTHCNDLKPTMEKFVNKLKNTDEVDIKFVNMAEEKNADGWYDWKTHYETYGDDTPASLNPDYISDPAQMKTLDDIEITGTPTMIYEKDGEVVNYEVGNDVIEALMKDIEEEYDI